MAKYQNYPVEIYENLRDMHHASAAKYGDATLFLQKEEGEYRSYSFRQYTDEVDALGTALCHRGLAGKRVIVTGENGYDWVRAYMAVVCGVGVVVPVDKEIPAEEIANIAKVSEASAILYSPKLEEKIASVPAGVERISFAEIDALIKEGKALLDGGDRTYLDAEIDSHAMSILLFTSGTTGVSKGVMLSHHNICFNLSEMCRMVYIGPEDRFLSVLPLHHVYECTCGFLCQVYRGSSVAFSEGLRYITRNMQEAQPTIINCVPLLLETMYSKVWANIRKQGLEKKVRAAIKATNLLPAALRDKAKRRVFAQVHKSFGGKLRLLVCGGAAVDPSVMEGLRDFGIATVQGYGLTECSPIAALNRDTFYRNDSAGLASPNTLLDIYDVQDDGTGEIRFKGENVMLGYYRMPDETTDVLRNGWFYTGDLGYLDADGFLHITGRKKNVIVTYNGKNIFPEELETYLARTPYVKESVVVGIVNPKKKDYDIVAIIHPDYERLEEAYGADYTRDQLDAEMKKAIAGVNNIVQSYKRIDDYVERTVEFSKNTSRKIKRQGLLEEVSAEYLKKISQ